MSMTDEEYAEFEKNMLNRYFYPKIDTLFNRHPHSFKVDTNSLKRFEFNLIDKWDVYEKIDGTNIRVVWNNNKFSFWGRTINAELPKELEQHLKDSFNKSMTELMNKLFPFDNFVYFFGEGYGAKIQNGKGYSDRQKFILFDILVAKNCFESIFLNRGSVEEIASKLGLDVVPYLGKMTRNEIVDLVSKGFPSNIGNVPLCEGIIASTQPLLLTRLHERVMFKLKHTDF